MRTGYNRIDGGDVLRTPNHSSKDSRNARFNYYGDSSYAERSSPKHCMSTRARFTDHLTNVREGGDDSQPQAGRFEHLNDRKGTRDGRSGTTSPKKAQAEKMHFFGIFKKKKKFDQIIEQEGMGENASMAEKEAFKGELRSIPPRAKSC